MSLIAAIVRTSGELVHVLVHGVRRIAIADAASAGYELQGSVEHSRVKALLESLMHVADFPEFLFDPTGFDFFLVRAERGGGGILFLQSFEGGLSGEHAALDGEVNPLQSGGVQEAGGIAENHPAIARNRRNRPPAAVWHRLRPVANHLSAFQQLRDQRMLFELLQHALRIETRVGIVEPGDKAKRDYVVFATVNPGATVFFGGERPA